MSFIKFLFTRVFIKQLLIAGISYLPCVILMLFWLKSTTNHGQKIEVPNLDRLSLDMAEEKLAELDLRFVVLDSSNYNPNFPKYSVIEQIPEAGEFVKENRKIYLTLNRSGYVFLEVPNVIGKTKKTGSSNLGFYGF